MDVTYNLKRQDLSQLPTPHAQISNQTNETVRIIQEKTKSTIKKVVVLAFFILLTGAASGYLIATTGTPAANAMLFWGGVGFGGLSFTMLIALVVIAEKARRFNNNERIEHDRFLNEDQGDQIIFDAMMEENATEGAVKYAIGKMVAEHYDQFVDYAIGRIFTEGRNAPLTAQEKQLLKVLAGDERILNHGPATQILIMQTLENQDDADRLVDLLSHEGYQNLVVQAQSIQVSLIVSKAIAYSAHTSLLTSEQQRKLMEKVSQNEACLIVMRLTERQYKDLSAHVLEAYANALPEGSGMVLTALSRSEETSKLTPEQQRKLMEKVSQEEANQIVARLTEQQYKDLTAHVLEAYANALPEGSGMVLTALSGSNYTSALTAGQQRELMEKVSQDGAIQIVARLTEEQYKDLSAHVLEAYANALPEGSSKVLTALSSSNYTPVLTLEQQRKLMEKVSQEEANQIAARLNQVKYDDLVTAVIGVYFSEPFVKNEKVISALLLATEKAASHENDQELLLLLEGNNDFAMAKSVMEKMTSERFKELANYINQAYYNLNSRPINDNVQKALYQHVLGLSEDVLNENLEVYKVIVAKNIENTADVFAGKISRQKDGYLKLRNLVVDNEKIENKEVRYKYALNILEKLGDEAVDFIDSLDKTNSMYQSGLHNRYEGMLLLLVKETSENVNISETRKNLCKLFEKASQRYQCLGYDFKSYNWKNFNMIVGIN